MEKYFNKEKYLEELAYLVNIDSGTGTADGVEKIADFLIGKYKELGLYVKKETFDSAFGPCVEVRNKPESEKIDLLLIGHMDTVFPIGTAASRPFTVVGNHAYGPGAADMKSGTLFCTVLAKYLLEERPDLSFCIAHNCDEEIGSVSSDKWLCDLAKKTVYCFDMEPGRSDGSFVKTRKGVCCIKLTMHGKSAHAGVNPDAGVSAILEMAKWICHFATPEHMNYGYRVNFGVIKGGTTYNTIPDYAECDIDVRFDGEDELKKVLDEFDVLVKTPFNKEVKAEYCITGKTPAMTLNENSLKLIKIVEEEGASLGQEVKFIGTGGGSDASRVTSQGAAAIDACGPIGFHMHNEKEYFLIDSIEERLQLLMNTIKRLPKA